MTSWIDGGCIGRIASIEFEMKKISKQFNKSDIRRRMK